MAKPDEQAGAPGYPAEFLRAVEQAVAGLGWQVRRWEPGGLVCLDAEGAENNFGLDNVFRRARGIERTDWVPFIVQHLSRISEGTQNARRDEELHSVAHRLLVRLSQPFGSAKVAELVWWRSIVPDQLLVALVVDRPDTMSYVSRKMIEESGRPAEEWLQVALDNLRQRTNADLLEPIEDTGVLLCCTGDAYDAARALVLDALLPEAEHGALIAVPNRDRLLALPLVREAVARLHLVKLVARRSFQEAPYPISSEIYWVRGEEWQHIPLTFEDGRITLRAPEEFADLLGQFRHEEDKP